MKKSLIVILFSMLFSSVFASIDKENLLEEIIFLRVNRRFGDTFFPVYFGGDGREVYLEINELLDMLEEDNLIFNEEKGVLEGELTYKNIYNPDQLERKKIKVELDEINLITIDGNKHIEAEALSKLLPFEYVFRDRDKYLLDVNTKFVLPVEAREIQERNRNNFRNGFGSGEEETEILRSEKKLFTPGIVQAKYFKSNFSDRDSNHILELNYYNQLLYGDFIYQGDIAPDIEKKYIELKYNEFAGNKALIIGDRSLQKESFYSTSSKGFQGVSILDGDIIVEEDASIATIEGQVLNGTTVELYQGNNMIDFQEVRTDNKFRFEDITLIGFSDEYILKFYYPDGSYEEKVVILMKDRDLQNKGESDYRLQVGSVDDELAYSMNYLYGVTENLTLGGGAFRSKSYKNYVNDSDVTFENIEADLIYRGRAERNPAIYSFKVFRDLNDLDASDLDYSKSSPVTVKSNISKKLYDYDLQLDFEEYSSIVSQGRRGYRKYGFNIANNKRELSHSINVERSEEFEGNRDKYTLNMRYNLGRSLRLSWNNSYSTSVSESQGDTVETRFGISYSGFSAVNLSLKAGAEFTDSETRESFDVDIKKRNRESGKGSYDYSLSTGVNNSEWYIKGTFKYYFTNWLNTPVAIDNSDLEIGLEIDKTINLARPFEKSSNPSPETAWVEGILFIDENGNGKIDDGEVVLEGVEVVRGSENGITNKEGYFFLDGIPSNDVYELRINSSSIDPMLKPVKENYNLLLSPSSGYHLDIPLLPVSAIMGDIFLEEMGDLSERERARILQRVKVFLRDENGIVQEVLSEIDGFFLIEDVLPGDYYLEIVYLGSESYQIDKNIYNINISVDNAGEFYEGFKFFIKPELQEEVLESLVTFDRP